MNCPPVTWAACLRLIADFDVMGRLPELAVPVLSVRPSSTACRPLITCESGRTGQRRALHAADRRHMPVYRRSGFTPEGGDGRLLASGTVQRAVAAGTLPSMMTFLLKAELPFLIVAGIIGQKIAAKLWSLAFKSEVPDTAQENVRLPPLIAAAVLEGTLYKLTRMGIDRSLRTAAAKSEGTWIGKTGQGE